MDSSFNTEWKILISTKIYNLTFTATAGFVGAKLLVKDQMTSSPM